MITLHWTTGNVFDTDWDRLTIGDSDCDIPMGLQGHWATVSMKENGYWLRNESKRPLNVEFGGAFMQLMPRHSLQLRGGVIINFGVDSLYIDEPIPESILL